MSKETKDKWEITIYEMTIIGKYFKSNNDFINIMKVNKKYKELVAMYHFNPINFVICFVIWRHSISIVG